MATAELRKSPTTDAGSIAAARESIAKREAALAAITREHAEKVVADTAALDAREAAIQQREENLAVQLELSEARSRSLDERAGRVGAVEGEVATKRAEVDRLIAYYKAGPG